VGSETLAEKGMVYSSASENADFVCAFVKIIMPTMAHLNPEFARPVNA
jgi:hypothetical protein